MLKLTHDNYHSTEANLAYMSRGQYLGFLDCEAGQIAKLSGEWVEEKSTELLVGSYVHSWNQGTRKQFIAENQGMFKKDGGLKVDYIAADKMIATLESDPLCMFTLQGQKEVILTGEFAGAMWKVMIDSYRPEKRRMTDLKTTKSIREQSWSVAHQTRVSFIETYRYVLQAAIYCEVERISAGRPEGDWLDFYLVAVSKESVPDKEIIDMRDPERYVRELEQVKNNMPRILKVKAGDAEPIRCERCNYCRSTKKLKSAVHYTAL